MKALGLEPIPGSEGKIRGVGGALEVASEIGFPILLKASAGGGGKGMRIVENEADLEDAYREASIEAEKAFGDPSLYVERFIERGRHIEFQVLTDTYGHAVHLGERECSIQRNHQKLVEESPSPAIDSAIRERMGAMVTEAVARIGYVNAGTVEFLMDDEGRLYFMEMNTRLQVEHPVTEMVTGIDIVAEQIKIAANEPLAIRQEEVRLDGNAIEARINAEDPYADFRPNPGTIGRFEPPGIDSIRIDTHVRPGYKIPPFYDSLIAKVIAHGPDRKAAIERLEEALRNFKIEGIKTTIPMHLEILASGEFRRGDYNNRSIPGWD
jgi:acetyl-CoA carboxylase biotin carboxylase subunit